MAKLYKDLKEPCKTMIEKELCLGCNKLENPEFISNPDCEYIKNKPKEIKEKWSGSQSKIF